MGTSLKCQERLQTRDLQLHKLIATSITLLGKQSKGKEVDEERQLHDWEYSISDDDDDEVESNYVASKEFKSCSLIVRTN